MMLRFAIGRPKSIGSRLYPMAIVNPRSWQPTTNNQLTHF